MRLAIPPVYFASEWAVCQRKSDYINRSPRVLPGGIPWAYSHLVSWKARMVSALVLLALACIGIVAVGLSRGGKRTYLADGSEVISVTADYGTNHSVVLPEVRSG